MRFRVVLCCVSLFLIPMKNPIEVFAYNFPNYHFDPRNKKSHGVGWNEWELVKAAKPRFEGHRQPLVPAWGYYNEAEPEWASKEIDLAADHALTGFIYDFYWYDDGPFLNRAIDEGFLGAPNNERLQFGLMLANHDWVDIFPATYGNPQPLMYPGTISPKTWEIMTDKVVEQYFSRPNYWAIEGKPYFSFFVLDTFINGMGGVAQSRAALDRFREKARQIGFSDIHFNVIAYNFVQALMKMPEHNEKQVIEELGISSLTPYCWAHNYNMSTCSFPKAPYSAAAQANYEAWEESQTRYPVPFYPNVSMGWDCTPRTVQSNPYDNRGYPWTAIFEGNTPAAFREALQRAKEFVASPQNGHGIVTINAWNEWTEGSYLLPDTVHGTAYLEAVRDVFGENGAL